MFYNVWFDYTQAYLLSFKVRLELKKNDVETWLLFSPESYKYEHDQSLLYKYKRLLSHHIKCIVCVLQ